MSRDYEHGGGVGAGATWSDPQALARALRALGHPTRVRAFAAFLDGELSPIDLVRRLDEPGMGLGAVAYHFKKLAAADLIELSQTIHRRGAVEHRYALTVRGRAVARVLDELSGKGEAAAVRDHERDSLSGDS